MENIISINCTVVAEDANGEQHVFSASAPTIDMCIEKLGQIERKVKGENAKVYEIFQDDKTLEVVDELVQEAKRLSVNYN